MPSQLPCIWLEPTNLCEISYRRYVSSDEGKDACTVSHATNPGCTPRVWGYHDARVVIDHREANGDPDLGRPPRGCEGDDARWPKACACGYVFARADLWQWNSRTLYRRSDNGELVTLLNCPAGSMWNAPWMSAYAPRPTPDGLYLVVLTPEGEWHIDGPSSGNGAGWTRSGALPNVTVTPSISIGKPQRLHGWLRNGVLEIDFP